MARAKRSDGRKKGRGSCCGPECCATEEGCCGLAPLGGCHVDAVVSVDVRGQMVLPKDVREKFGIGADDRLAVVSWERGGRPCCLTLLRADELADAVRRTYGPVLGDAVRG